MSLQEFLSLFPLFALLAWAAAGDLRTRRIPNVLSLILVLSGLTLSFTAMGVCSPTKSAAGLATGFGLTVMLFVIGAIGGGDVKLLAGVGAWIGPVPVLYVFLTTAVIGMVIVLCQATLNGRLATLFRNSTVLVMGLAHAGETGLGHFAETGRTAPRSVDKPLPYAVPVLLATILVVLSS